MAAMAAMTAITRDDSDAPVSVIPCPVMKKRIRSFFGWGPLP
jgi:hypothetical protein